MKTYVDDQDTALNNSIVTYIGDVNTSMVTYIGEVNTSMKTYVDDTNTSMKTYVDDEITGISTGNPFDQSLNTTDNVTFNNLNITENLTVGSGTTYLDLYYNGSINLFDTLGNNAFFPDNITADYFFGNGSLLTGIATDVLITTTNTSMKTYVDDRDSTYNTSIVTYVDDTNTSMKTYVDETFRLQSWNNLTGIPHATPNDGDTTHFSLADEIYDWVIGLGYATSTYVDNQIAAIGNWSADKNDYSTTTEANALYVNLSGDIMTGELNMTLNNISQTNYQTYCYNATTCWKQYVNASGYLIMEEI